MSATKLCAVCKKDKKISDYYITKSSGSPMNRCKECHNKASRKNAIKRARKLVVKINRDSKKKIIMKKSGMDAGMNLKEGIWYLLNDGTIGCAKKTKNEAVFTIGSRKYNQAGNAYGGAKGIADVLSQIEVPVIVPIKAKQQVADWCVLKEGSWTIVHTQTKADIEASYGDYMLLSGTQCEVQMTKQEWLEVFLQLCESGMYLHKGIYVTRFTKPIDFKDKNSPGLEQAMEEMEDLGFVGIAGGFVIDPVHSFRIRFQWHDITDHPY